ncbi:restriction endonuclease subunit S [Enterococcus faecium]|uniref:restriction endonuclease subunit S n=3 Tax=Enterococcus TaxID=1350 RepID=UPI001E354403|nr:restriction endonuclease subunit S [Enterococcus faecium]MCD4914823.1 restriction endonuclease subunit S [Enterococcus faecium]MCD5088349.1 restriction endonuclease subunit S [Enterococcus faecium]
MSNDTQPEIRFPGFTEDWEQRKLGDITESFSGGTPTAGKSEYYGGDIPFIRSGEISSELTELFITENGLNNSSAKMVKAGDILYALYGATSGEVSISRINGAINQAILAIRPTKNDNSYLIVQWLRKQKDTIISTYLQGGQGNLSGSIVKDLVITLPQDKEEQNKIGAFFKQLDDTIALHQRKLDLLKETKKGFLQKMFPKNGAKVPEIRFPGFTEDWEQRKLGDITESFSGGTPTAGKSEYYGGDIPFIRSGEISSELTELFITENGLNNSSAKMVKAGDILYALYGATSGEVSISRINGAINQAILAIRPTKNDNSYLIVQWLRKQKDTIISTYLQGGQGNLSGSIVKDLVITLPQDKEEQNKIGAFFKQLDDTIALHQRKLDLLKETKKGFLQKMFV